MDTATRVTAMRATATTDPSLFLTAADAVLSRHPVATNVIASTAHAAAAGTGGTPDSTWFLLTASGDGDAAPSPGVVAVAMHTPPFPLLVAPAPPGAAQAYAAALFALFRIEGRTTDGVNGTRPEADVCAAHWQQHLGVTPRVAMGQGMYDLTHLVPPPQVTGRPRLATPDDEQLLVSWLHAFHAEVDPEAPQFDQLVLLRSWTATGALLVWEVDGRPVSLAGARPPAAGVSRIGPVYTPPDERGHGYAAGVTAAATQQALDGGARRCMLYTDLANPTSNAIYQRLGYARVGDAVRYVFDVGS